MLTRTLYGEEAAKHPDLLPEREKEQIRSLSSAVAAVVGGVVGNSNSDNTMAGILADAQTGGVVGRNAVENNYLTANLIDRFKTGAQSKESLISLFKVNQNNLLAQCGRNQGSTQCRDAARYTLAFINHPDAMHYFPDQVREAGNNLARFPQIPEVKSFRWSDYNRGMGSVIVSSLKGEHLPSGDKMGYLTGVFKSLAGAARDAQTPGELLYGSPVGAFGDNQWARPDPYELNTKQELLGSYGGMAVGAFTGRPAIRGRMPGLAGRGSGRTPPAARTPSPVDGEMAGGNRPLKASFSEKMAGEVKILPGANPDGNELRAGRGLAEQFGYEVTHQPTASSMGIPNQRTADLSVSGIGQVDVYSPRSTSLTSIARGIEGKNSQASAVIVQTTIPDVDMESIANRTWGKSTARNIQTIFFQRSDGSIIRFNRPKGK